MMVSIMYRGWFIHMLERFPKPEDFSQALYSFDVGRNDLHLGLKLMTQEKLKETVDDIR